MKSLVASVDDRLNPIVIKELRQGVNGRFISAVLILFLLISVVIMGIFLMVADSQSGDTSEYGQVVLGTMNGILIITCLLFLPTFAAVRLAGEWSDTNTDLLFITTIRPRAIIWGKVLATSLLAVLIYSACMPFMMLTFLLRGVDLPTILLVLVVGFLTTLACIQLGVFVSTLTTARGFRVLLAMGLLFTLGMAAIYQIIASVGIIQFGVASQMESVEFWVGATALLVVFASAMALMYAFSVAMISPPTSNRALPVRLTMVGVLALNLLVVLGWAAAASGWFAALTGVSAPSDIVDNATIAWLFGSTAITCLQCYIAICERERPGDRVRRQVPRNPLLRLPAFVLFSGAAGGLAFAALLAVVCIGGAAALYAVTRGVSGQVEESLLICTGLVLYAYAYAMSGLIVRRYLLGNVVRPEHTWSLSLVLAAMGCTLPPVLAYFVFSGNWSDSARVWMLPNPLALNFDNSDSLRNAALLFVSVWSILATLAAIPWLIGQLGRFTPLPQDPPQPEPTTAAVTDG